MRTALDDRQSPAGRNETLGDMLRRVAYVQLPSRFYAALQVGLPLAYQFWQWGMTRAAGWCLVASAFGLWGLSQQHVEGAAEAELIAYPSSRRLWRLTRWVAAAAGGIIAVGLILEGFAQVLSVVFKCPGCSG